MNFGLAFKYVFNDEAWFKKVAIPAICALIPVVGPFIVVGWALKAARNVIEGNEEYALPELEFGADLGRGFMAFLINLIYMLPVIIFGGIAAGLFSFGGSADDVLQIILFIVGGCFGLIGLLLALLIMFLSVVGVANYVAKGEFGAAFRFKELIGMLKKSFVAWLLVIVGNILAVGLIGPLGGIACGIGALLTTAYGNLVYSHLLGQAYNKATEPTIGEMEEI